MTNNPAGAALAEIRQLHSDIDCHAVAYMCVGKVPRLVDAVEAALKHHQRVPLFGSAATADEPGACPHDPDQDWDCHFENPEEPGEWLCTEKPEGDACSGCPGSPDGEYADWPCPEYEAILAALTGEANGR